MNASSPKRWFIGILIMLLSLVPAQSASADSHRSPLQVDPVTWYVSTLGSDTNDCQSPVSPCQSINAAVTMAAEGDTIKVAIGAYTGTGTEVVLINKSLTLSGGWDETFSTQSGTSTIDGEGVRRGIAVSSTTAVAYIDTFKVQGGRASETYNGGGGISNKGTLSLNNLIITNNITSGYNARGGGILNKNIQ